MQRKGAPQPRHRWRVDVDVALEASRDVLTVWRSVAAWPDAPPMAGGVWDDWPQRLAQGLAVCRREAAAVQALIQEESRG